MFGLQKKNPEWLNGYNPSEDRFTEDNFNLRKKAWWRLFVYNAWQDNQQMHEQLGEDAIKCAAGFTENDRYVVLKKKLGRDTFPFALEMKEENHYGRESFLGPMGKILGQVFLVRPSTLKFLDSEVLNGVQFDRRRIKVDVPFREEGDMNTPRTMKMDAWAYIGREDFWIHGHGINDVYIGDVRRFCTVKSNLNQNKESKVYYYYNDKFEVGRE